MTVPSRFCVGDVTVDLVVADLLAAGLETMFDQLVAVVIDAQGCVLDFDSEAKTCLRLHPW